MVYTFVHEVAHFLFHFTKVTRGHFTGRDAKPYKSWRQHLFSLYYIYSIHKMSKYNEKYPSQFPRASTYSDVPSVRPTVQKSKTLNRETHSQQRKLSTENSIVVVTSFTAFKLTTELIHPLKKTGCVVESSARRQ